LGSHLFVFNTSKDSNDTETYFQVGSKSGRFVFNSELRPGIEELIADLSDYRVHVLSGDKDKDKELIESIVGTRETIHFNQTPNDKLEYIMKLQDEGRKVMMIGDGLNDAGGLGVAHVGVAVSEDVFRFTPSSDAIIEASKLKDL